MSRRRSSRNSRREKRKFSEIESLSDRNRVGKNLPLLTKKQVKYLQEANRKYNFFAGAAGSGKTFLGTVFLIAEKIMLSGNKPIKLTKEQIEEDNKLKILRARKVGKILRGTRKVVLSGRNFKPIARKGDIAIIGNTIATVVRNVIDPMREFYGPGKIGTLSNNNTVMMFGKKVRVFGADKVSNKTKIQGLNLEYAYCDEIATWSKDVFYMLLTRLRLENSHFDAACNPDIPKHWLKLWIDEKIEQDKVRSENKKNTFYLSTTIYDAKLSDNPIINKRLIQEQLDSMSKGSAEYRRLMLGEWAANEGLCYKTYADKPDSYLVSREEMPARFTKITIGVDFGGTKSKHAFVATGYDLSSNSIYILKSTRAEPGNPDKLNKDFTAFLLDVESTFGQDVEAIYADNAEPVLIAGMRSYLLDMKIYRNVENAAKKKVNDRVRCLDMLHCLNRVKILEGNGTKTIRDAMAEAVWDGKEDEKRLDDLSTDIDSMDAFEYTFERDMGYLVSIHTV